MDYIVDMIRNQGLGYGEGYINPPRGPNYDLICLYRETKKWDRMDERNNLQK